MSETHPQGGARVQVSGQPPGSQLPIRDPLPLNLVLGVVLHLGTYNYWSTGKDPSYHGGRHLFTQGRACLVLHQQLQAAQDPQRKPAASRNSPIVPLHVKCRVENCLIEVLLSLHGSYISKEDKCDRVQRQMQQHVWECVRGGRGLSACAERARYQPSEKTSLLNLTVDCL